MYLGEPVMIDLVVHPFEVQWRRHVGEATSDVVFKVAFWMGN